MDDAEALAAKVREFIRSHRPPVVVLDTTTLYGDYQLVGNVWSQSFTLASRGLLRLVFPEPVVREVARHQRRATVAADNKNIDQLRDAIKALAKLVSLPSIDAANLRREIKKRAQEYEGWLRTEIASRGGEIRHVPTISHSTVLTWAIEERQPFKEGGEGYRDALIWATILELASELTNLDHILLVTNNHSDFHEKPVPQLGKALLADLGDLGNDAARVSTFSTLQEALDYMGPFPAEDDEAWEDAEESDGHSSVMELIREAVNSASGNLVGTDVSERLLDDINATQDKERLPTEIESVSIYLADPHLDSLEWDAYENLGDDVLLGSAKVHGTVTFDGYLPKWEYYALSNETDVEVLDADHNDHYAWVAIDREVTLSFTVRVDVGSRYIEEIEFDGIEA